MPNNSLIEENADLLVVNEGTISYSAGTDIKIINDVISVDTNGTMPSGQYNFIAGEGTYISGSHNAVFGAGCSANGIGNADFGNTNTVVGNSNAVFGNLCSLTGYCNIEAGNYNKLSGQSNAVFGNSNSISGYSNLVYGETNYGLDVDNGYHFVKNIIGGGNNQLKTKYFVSNTVFGEYISATSGEHRSNFYGGRNLNINVDEGQYGGTFNNNFIFGFGHNLSARSVYDNGIIGSNNNISAESFSYNSILGNSNTIFAPSESVYASFIAGQSNAISSNGLYQEFVFGYDNIIEDSLNSGADYHTSLGSIVGNYNEVKDGFAVNVLGYNNKVSGNGTNGGYAIVNGSNNQLQKIGSNYTVINGTYNAITGESDYVYGGSNTINSGTVNYIVGSMNTTSGFNAHTYGYYNTVKTTSSNNSGSYVLGYGNNVESNATMAIGYNLNVPTTVSGEQILVGYPNSYLKITPSSIDRYVNGSNKELFEAVYGQTPYSAIDAAVKSNKIVYCRISPTGASRMAFLAYGGNNNYEFQYYRSLNQHTSANQGDEVYVYTIASTGWTSAMRKTYTQIQVGAGLTSTYNNGVLTISLA